MTKAQAALEFILLLSFLFLLFVSFFGIIQGRLTEALENKVKHAVLDQRNMLEHKIKTTMAMEEIFAGEIELPALLNGKEYRVILRCADTGGKKVGELMVLYSEEPTHESSFSLPQNVDLQGCPPDKELAKGKLCIRKSNGQIALLNGTCT